MFQFPLKELVKDEKFKSIMNEMDWNVSKILNGNYKLWLYTWCLWASNPQKNMSILEAGPGGKGGILRYCSNRGCILNAVDLRKLHKNLKSIKNLHYYNNDLTSTGLKDNLFDIIYCVSVIEHMKPKVRNGFFKEMSRILKVGGKMYLTTVEKQLVHDGSENIAMKGGLIYPVPMNEILKEKEHLKLIKAGDFTDHPEYKRPDIFWKIGGGKNQKKTWTEYCSILEKI